MDFLKKASYYLSNNQNLRRGIFISIAIIFLLVVVLFNSDIQNLLKGPGAGKAATPPIESEKNWIDWDDMDNARSNAKMIDVIQNGNRWLYSIGGIEKVYDDSIPGDKISLISSVERIQINNDGSPMLDPNTGIPITFWESAPTMNFGHAEFGLLEYNGYIYVISGDMHLPVMDDPVNEFPLLYSTIERLSLTDPLAQWEVMALVTGVNFYPEVKIWNNELHIVGGVYGNPFNGSGWDAYGVNPSTQDPLLLPGDVAAWENIKNKPIIGDVPIGLSAGGLEEPIDGIVPLPGGGGVVIPIPGGGGVVTYNPSTTGNQIMIQQVIPPPTNFNWDPNAPTDYSQLLSDLLRNGEFATTVSEHYIVYLNDFTWTGGELDSDYISSQPLFEDSWVEGKVIRMAHLRFVVTRIAIINGLDWPTIRPVPQGRYGHKLVVHNNNATSSEELLVIGGASWSNPWNIKIQYTDNDGIFHVDVTTSFLFWVNDHGIHPFTNTREWLPPGDDYPYIPLGGYDYKYVGNIAYRWNINGQYWQGTNTNMASPEFLPGGYNQPELSHDYAFEDEDNNKRGKAFFGLAELNLPGDEDVFVVSGGLENVPYDADDNNFYRGGPNYICFGIPIQITNTVHKLEAIENNGWQWFDNLENPNLAPNSYGLTSISLGNYRSLAINGQIEFHVTEDDQFTNTHVPDYSLRSTNYTSMFDNVAWVDMPSDQPGNNLTNLAYAATYDVRTTVGGKTTIYVYRAGGSVIGATELPDARVKTQYMGPFIYGESGVPNPGTSEFSVEPSSVLADGMHYATASGVLRDYYGAPIAGKQIAITINDDPFPPTNNGDIKVLPVPDNLKVRAQDTPDMTVVVNAGYALFDDGEGGLEKVEIGVTNSDPFLAPVSAFNRIDVLVLTDEGLLNIIQGIESATPEIPSIPDDTIVLAGVYLRPGQTEILDLDDTIANYVTDARSDDLRFGSGNSPGQSGYSEEFLETDASGAIQFRLSSTIAGQHKVWLHLNISPIENSAWFVKVGPWDVEFTLDGVPTRLSTIEAEPNQVLANGIETSTVTVTLLDGNGLAASDYWVDIFSNRNKFSTNGYITSFAESAVAGQIIVTSFDHNLPEGSNITISDTVNYNRIYTISNVNLNTFEITDTWVADETGTWTVDLVDNVSLSPNYTNPISDSYGQVQFIVNSRISGLSMIFGKYSLDKEGLSSNFKYVIGADTIEFGGYISGLEPGYGRQGQSLEYIIATGAQTNWDDTTTEVVFIPPGKISFQENTGSTKGVIRIIADGYDSVELKIIAPDYPNADLELTISAGSGSFFGFIPTTLNGAGEANFIYNSGTQAGIVKILAQVNGGLLAGGIEDELWFIEDEPIANNYELEITVTNPHLDDGINVTEVRSAIWLNGATKTIVDNQTNSFNFSSDDDGQFNPNPTDNNSLGVATTTYTKDTTDGRTYIFVEVDFKPNPTDSAIHLMASQLIVKKSSGSVDGITTDSLTVVNAEKIDLGGKTNSNNYVHISENALIGLWTVSIYTPNVDSGPFGLSMDETVQYPFVVLPSGGINGFDPQIVSIQPWYGVFGETQKVVDIIGINTNFSDKPWLGEEFVSIVTFASTDIGQPTDAITVTDIEVINLTHLQATITISENTTALGWYNISVTTGDEVALKPGDQDFLVTGVSNFALHLYSDLPDNEIPRDGQSQANITARVVFVDPTDGSVTPREDVDITFNHSDAGPIKPPNLAPLETFTNEDGFAYSLYTTDAGEENELIDITASAIVYPISGDPVVISNKISILKIVHPYDGFTLNALPNSLPLYGLPNYSILTAEGLPSDSNISVWFSKIMGKGNVIPLQTSTSTGTALSRYYSAPEAERIPETIEIEAFAVVPGIGIIKSNSTLIQVGEDDADYKLNLTAIPNEVQVGGILTSDVTAALSFLKQPSSNWPIHFELIQEQAGDYITKTLVWTDYPTGLAKTEFVPGYIAGAIMVRARPLGLNIVKDVIINKIADQSPDEYLTVITAVPRYVPTSNDGSDYSTVTVTVRNKDFTPLGSVTVKLTTDRIADTIRLDDGSISDTTSTNENGQAIFRVSSTEIGVSLVEAIVSTFSVSTDIVFEDSALLTSRILDVRVPFQARDYDNLTWIYITEEVNSGDPLVFGNEVYTKLARPDDRLSVLANIKMYFHIDQTYNLWVKGRNHLSRVEQFFPGDKIGEGETIVIDMTKIINSKEYGLFVADIEPDERDIDGNGNMVPSPFHDNAINAFDFGLLITNFYKNHYTANINWPIDEIVNNFDALFIFMNWGDGETGGPPPYK